jgi:serine/threonine protein phosphatase 1
MNDAPPRTLAIGDIHGCADALDSLLTIVRPTPSDMVVILGDVVDRGLRSREVVERLIQLRAECRLVFILGNHEETILDAVREPDAYLDIWMTWGGRSTLDSYEGLAKIPASHIEFLKSGLPFWETESHIFVHANLEPDLPLAEQKTSVLRWRRLKNATPPPHRSGKTVICGHTRQHSGLPWVMPGWVCIDTSASDGGWLTCLDVASNHVYQAAENGATRDFPLAVEIA